LQPEEPPRLVGPNLLLAHPGRLDLGRRPIPPHPALGLRPSTGVALETRPDANSPNRRSLVHHSLTYTTNPPKSSTNEITNLSAWLLTWLLTLVLSSWYRGRETDTFARNVMRAEL